MANSTTNLDTISSSQAQKEVTANALFDAGSPPTIGGRRASACSGLTWGYYGGNIRVAGVLTQVANGTLLLFASNTNYVEMTTAGVVSVTIAGFTAGRIPLYTIVAGASSVTSYTDCRAFVLAARDTTAPLATAENSFMVSGASPYSWSEKTLAQTKTILAASETTAGVAEQATTTEVLTGTDASRFCTPAGVIAADGIIASSRSIGQGLNMLVAASGSNGVAVADSAEIDFDTGDFSVVWRGWLPDWTPSAAVVLLQKNDGSNGYTLSVNTSGALVLRLNATDYTSSASMYTLGLSSDYKPLTLSVSVVRETASVAGSVTFYVNGLILGSAQVIGAASPTTVTNAVSLYVLGTSTTRSAGVCFLAAVFNRSITATGHLRLHHNGIDFADKWGAQTAKYTSNFTAGADSWTATAGTAAGNIDGIGGVDDTLRLTVDGTNAAHYLTFPYALVVGKRYQVQYDYYVPAAQSNVDGLRLGNSGSADMDLTVQSVTGTWTTVKSAVFTAGATALVVYALDGGVVTFQDAGSDDVLYLKNVTVTEVGATLALEGEGLQPDPGQWLDSSTNKLHAMQPAAGSCLVRNKREFEIRWTNTWAGTHEAQYVGGVNQAILPANCYITNIIGVISGATIEDIILGDGSDTDHWVAITTGLAAGTVAFTIANAISDGTNYKLVVDPDANFTGSIAWTIRGIILQ